jgi:hypothetical protein
VLFQSVALPLELTKAAAKFRYLLTLESPELYEADAEALTKVTAVCRHWSKMLQTISDSSRRRLKRLFHCKMLFYK